MNANTIDHRSVRLITRVRSLKWLGHARCLILGAIVTALWAATALPADATTAPAAGTTVTHTSELALPNPGSGGAGANLGTSAALSANGTTAVLGAPYRTVYDRSSGEGDAYTLIGGKWSAGSELNLGAPAGDGSLIGLSVAVSGNGNTALIGAPMRAIVGAGQAGAAYLYTGSHGSWGQAIRFNLGSKAVFGDQYGHAVALSADGKTALIGTPYRTADGSSLEGAGEIYTLNGGKWQGPTELSLKKAGGDSLGWSAALSANGRVALLGAPNRGHGGRGGLHAEERHVAQDGRAERGFGEFADGWFRSLGRPERQRHNRSRRDQVAASLRGRTIARRGRGLCVQVGQVAPLQRAEPATSRDLERRPRSLGEPHAAGTRALVGAPGRSVNGQSSAGAAELFTLSHGQWSKPVQLSLGKKAGPDGLGTSVALSASGSTALVGAMTRTVGGESTGAGEVFSIH